MPKHFHELSDAARSAIVDAAIGLPDTNLPEPVKDEIREWAEPWPDEIEATSARDEVDT